MSHEQGPQGASLEDGQCSDRWEWGGACLVEGMEWAEMWGGGARKQWVSLDYEKLMEMDRGQTIKFSFAFLWLPLWHMKVPEVGVESELQLCGYAIATVAPHLCHSLQ